LFRNFQTSFNLSICGRSYEKASIAKNTITHTKKVCLCIYLGTQIFDLHADGQSPCGGPDDTLSKYTKARITNFLRTVVRPNEIITRINQSCGQRGFVRRFTTMKRFILQLPMIK